MAFLWSTPVLTGILLICLILSYYSLHYLLSPLKDIPGPFLAKLTNFWRVHDYYHLRSPETQKALHAKHGVAVRLGPNLVALNDPNLVPVIYNSRGSFRKVCQERPTTTATCHVSFRLRMDHALLTHRSG